MEIDKERYKRNLLLPEVGEEGQKKLAESRVLVVGAGGLGSPVSLYLAAAGVGTIGIADFDRVDVSNLQRQILYREQDIGKAKAELAAEQLQSRNHSVQVELYPEGITAENAEEILGNSDGIIVPGGFGDRGVEGMITAAKYAREHKIPYLGLCLGMQVAIIEYARHVCRLNDAHSIELDPNTTHPVIALMPDQDGIEDIGGTLRLGSYPCVLDTDSLAYQVYGEETIHERHRHRYEVNNDYRNILTENGMKLCGLSPDGRIVEMVEIPGHPWFVATQAHPELKSRPNRPHPLFKGFIKAATEIRKQK